MVRAAKVKTSEAEEPRDQAPETEVEEGKGQNPDQAKTEKAAAEAEKPEAKDAEQAKKPATEPKRAEAKDAAKVEKAIALGKDMMDQGGVTKADVARKTYELIHGEDQEIIAQAFIEGTGLTAKGAQTYFYNCKRKFKK